MAYASPEDMQLFVDTRRLQQLCSDSGTPVTDLDNNAVLLAMLARASEEVQASALRGQRYSITELQALADSGSDGYYLVGLVCDLAFGYLVSRRGLSATEVDRQAPAFKKALSTLERLNQGEIIFPLTGELSQEEAGTAGLADLSTSTSAPASYTTRAFGVLLPSRPYGRFGGTCGSC